MKILDKAAQKLIDNPDYMLIIAYTASLFSWVIFLNLISNRYAIGAALGIIYIVGMAAYLTLSILYIRRWSHAVGYDRPKKIYNEAVLAALLPAILLIGLPLKMLHERFFQ